MKFYFQTKGQVFLMNYEQFRRDLHGGNCETGPSTGLKHKLRAEPHVSFRAQLPPPAMPRSKLKAGPNLAQIRTCIRYETLL